MFFHETFWAAALAVQAYSSLHIPELLRRYMQQENGDWTVHNQFAEQRNNFRVRTVARGKRPDHLLCGDPGRHGSPCCRNGYSDPAKHPVHDALTELPAAEKPQTEDTLIPLSAAF